MKPLLYLNPEGTLLLSGDPNDADPQLGANINPYASTFLAWATKHFHVRWLSDIPPAHAFLLANQLGVPGHEIPYTSFAENKASAIKPHSDFYWCDSFLTPMDLAWLTQHGKTDRLLPVGTASGITETHKDWLASKLHVRK